MKKPENLNQTHIKNFMGYTIIFLTFIASIICIFRNIELPKVGAIFLLGVVTGFLFIAGDSINRIIISFDLKNQTGKIEAAVQKAQLDVEQIGSLLSAIQSQKQTIDMITRDANAIQLKVKELENISIEAHNLAQQIDIAVQKVNSKADDAIIKFDEINKSFEKRVEQGIYETLNKTLKNSGLKKPPSL